MKIAMITNFEKQNAKFCTDEIGALLGRYNAEVINAAYKYDEEEIDSNIFTDNDIIIAVGGDGTIIHTAKTAARFDKPVLGVNAGKVGFTAGVEADELDLISRLFTGEFGIQKRYMLEVQIESKENIKSILALNDAVIAGMYTKIISYNMAISGFEKYNYRADGFIFSTPTGSTAYSLSAGGPILEPTMKNITYTPICPHSLFNRSVIFDSETVLEITIGNDTGEVHLTVDGAAPIKIPNTEKITFKCSDNYARLIRLNKRNFYDVLYAKIIN